MAVATNVWTAEDLLALGDDAPFELIRGELREVSPNTGWHGLVVGRFVFELGQYRQTSFEGEVFTANAGYFAEHNPDTVIAPDLFFIGTDRMPSEKDLKRDFVRVPPNAVIEVASYSKRLPTVEEKVPIYLGSGVGLVIVADSGLEVISLHTSDGRVQTFGVHDILDGGEALPGFRVPVARIFR